MHNIKISLGGYITGTLILTIFGLLVWNFGANMLAGVCFGGAVSYASFVFLALFDGDCDEKEERIADLEDVLNEIYQHTSCTEAQSELIESVFEIEKPVSVVVAPVSMEIIEQFQRAAGLTNKNAEK